MMVQSSLYKLWFLIIPTKLAFFFGYCFEPLYFIQILPASLILPNFCRLGKISDLQITVKWNWDLLFIQKSNIFFKDVLTSQGCRQGGGASAPPKFDRSINSISTRGADYAHHYYQPPRIFRPCNGPASIWQNYCSLQSLKKLNVNNDVVRCAVVF